MTLFIPKEVAEAGQAEFGAFEVPEIKSTSVVFRTQHVFRVTGSVTAATLLGYPIRLAANQTAKVVAVDGLLTSGTSAVATPRLAGTNVAGGAVTATPAGTGSASVTGLGVAVTDGQKLDVVVSAPTGTPVDLTVTVTIEMSVKLTDVVDEDVY